MFVDYKLKGRRGIDDLKNNLPERAAEWWTDKEWAEWRAGEAERKAEDLAYIERLREAGNYGTEYTITVSLIPHPDYDSPWESPPLESFSFDILDFSKWKSDEN